MIETLTQQLNNPNNILIIVGLLLLFSELFVGIETGFDLVLIGSILIMGGFTGVAFSNFWISIIISIILCILYFAFGRKIIKKKIIVVTHSTNIDKLIAHKGVVVKQITPQANGIVKIKNEQWRAESNENIDKGQSIEVVSVSGVTLLVKKLQENE